MTAVYLRVSESEPCCAGHTPDGGSSNVPSSWSSSETVRLSDATTSPEVTVPVSASPAIDPLTFPPPMHPPGERMVPEIALPLWTRSACTETVCPRAVATPDQSPLRSAAGLAEFEVEVTEPPELPEHARSAKEKARRGLRMPVSGATRALL